MWRYANVRFLYSNPVDSLYNEPFVIPEIVVYIKSKYSLMQALRMIVDSSYLGPYTEIDPRTVKYDKPTKI